MFTFQLMLSNGSIISESVPAPLWKWHQAFTMACKGVEERLGLSAPAGIRCLDYEWSSSDPDAD